jgi:hypothetical protein
VEGSCEHGNEPWLHNLAASQEGLSSVMLVRKQIFWLSPPLPFGKKPGAAHVYVCFILFNDAFSTSSSAWRRMRVTNIKGNVRSPLQVTAQ